MNVIEELNKFDKDKCNLLEKSYQNSKKRENRMV